VGKRVHNPLPVASPVMVKGSVPFRKMPRAVTRDVRISNVVYDIMAHVIKEATGSGLTVDVLMGDLVLWDKIVRGEPSSITIHDIAEAEVKLGREVLYVVHKHKRVADHLVEDVRDSSSHAARLFGGEGS